MPGGSDIDRDINKDLADFGKKLKEQALAKGIQTPPADQNTQVANVQPTQISTQAAQIAAIVEPTPPAPAAATPTQPSVTPVKDEPTGPDSTSTDPPLDTEEPVPAWDKDLETPPVKDEPLTFESLGSALKLEKTPKSTAELVEQFTAQQLKIKALEASQEQSLDDIDPELKEVVQFAKNKGNWKQFLSTKVVNFNNADPVSLFNQSVEQQFKKPDGSIDFDAADAELAQIPDAVKRAQGNIMKQNLIAQQENRRAQILQEAERRQTDFNRNLAEAAKKLPEYLTKDKVGIQVEPKHADFLYEGIRNGKLVEKHLGKVDISGIAPEKLIRTLAMAEWGERISKTQFDQGVVQGKKQLLKSTQNVQLNTPAIPPAPNVADPNKVETPAEKMAKVMSRNKQPGSL